MKLRCLLLVWHMSLANFVRIFHRILLKKSLCTPGSRVSVPPVGMPSFSLSVWNVFRSWAWAARFYFQYIGLFSVLELNSVSTPSPLPQGVNKWHASSWGSSLWGSWWNTDSQWFKMTSVFLLLRGKTSQGLSLLHAQWCSSLPHEFTVSIYPGVFL